MTDQISTLIPSLCLVGEYIQDNVLKGYRLVEGYPTSYLWQYEVVMEKAETNIPVIPMPSVGRKGAAPKDVK